jgi:hypothetical protein
MNGKIKEVVAGGITATVAAMFLLGCAAETKPVMGVEAPDWVKKGSGAFTGERGRAFYGVGSASGIRNYSLLRATAENRARAEIAKIFEVYVAALMKDYMASTTAGDFSATSEEQHVERAQKTFTKATLSGVQIVDAWEHPNGTYFALAVLDLEAFKDLNERAKELSARIRDYVRRNAEKMFDELEKEEAKHE